MKNIGNINLDETLCYNTDYDYETSLGQINDLGQSIDDKIGILIILKEKNTIGNIDGQKIDFHYKTADIYGPYIPVKTKNDKGEEIVKMLNNKHEELSKKISTHRIGGSNPFGDIDHNKYDVYALKNVENIIT